MTKQYHQIRDFAGLANKRDARDIGIGLSKAQNISLDQSGIIRTIGGLEVHGEVPTHAAIIAPGAGLFPYGSDHYRGVGTVVDLLADNNAASDQQTEANATTGWTTLGSVTSFASVADTDGGAIASNGTSYILKLVSSGAASVRQASFPTIIGQRHKFSIDLYSPDTTFQIRIRDNPLTTEIIKVVELTTGSWVTVFGEFIAISENSEIIITVGVGTSYYDKAYVTAIPQPDLDTTWLALADAANAQIDLYNSRDDSFTVGLLDFGTVASFVGASAGNVDFPTSNTLTDSASGFLNANIKEGKIYKISGCSTQTANNILFVAERVIDGTIYARGNPFTITAAEAGTVTLTEYNPVDFNFIDDALSASPVGGGIVLRPKQYRFVDRIHFLGAGASEQKYQDWFENNLGPVPPTDISATANNGDQAVGDIGTSGTGMEIGITTTANDGSWLAGVYVIAESFIYDDGQESELYVPSTAEEFGTTIVDNDSLTITARAKGPYDERLSGSRFYARLKDTDDAWVLLVDISLADGARATLSGQYNSWNESSTATVAYTGNFKSIRPNLEDTYEGLAGSSPEVKVEIFSEDNRFYDASVIAGNRTFIFGPRYTDAGGKIVHFRDRIIFSRINEHDVFPINNLIDVTSSDAEDFVAGAIYGSDLLCFKQNTLYIVDISDPLLFRMKEDQQKGTYPFRGISRPAAMFETPHGLAWCNRFGLWLYNGAEIIDILGDRVERSKHPLAYQRHFHFGDIGDTLMVSKNAAIFNIFDGGGTFEAVINPRSDGEGDQTRIVEKRGGSNGWVINLASESAGFVKLRLLQDFSSTDGSWITTAAVIPLNTESRITITYDNTTVGNDPIFLLNGVVVASEEELTPVGTRLSDINNDLYIGNRVAGDRTFDGSIAELVLYNRIISTSEALARFNGGEIAFADLGASQVNLLSNPEWTTDTSDWTNNNVTHTRVDSASDPGTGSTTAIPPATNDECGKIVDGGSAASIREEIAVTVGKNHCMSGLYYAPSGNAVNNAQARIFSETGNRQGDEDAQVDLTTQDAWTYYSAEYASTTSLSVFTLTPPTTTNDILYGDRQSLKQIGAVLILKTEDIPGTHDSSVWPDASGNSLDAVFNGATPILPDTWEDFWTDFSIVGYHGKTNQLIVMRDCTGHYSLGADYGDCVIVDLDTLFLITGRRIFDAKTAYTNWATDWNGDLIIAKQSGANVITEKWTDEPQLQAVGLIHIETRDIDFGNPAYIDIIDAFTATIQTQTGQTNPLSYALDGSLTWITITGNFITAQLWAKFLAMPTAFNCNTLRLRIQNNTNADILSINELVVRHDPQVLKLS